MTHVIDTLELYRLVSDPRKNTKLAEMLGHVNETGRLFMSVVSHGEVRRLVFLRPTLALRNITEADYNKVLRFLGPDRLIDFDERVAETWAEMTAQIPAEDYPGVSSEELMVAATARHYNYSLITSSPKDWHQVLTDLNFAYVD